MNFIIGGRMGDAIHMLYVVANTPGKHDVFVTDQRDLHSDGFIYDLDKTIEELKPVLMKQDYINSIQAYNGEDAINLNIWRRYAYSASWTNLLSKTFNVPVNDKPWIKMPIPYMDNGKVIHCSVHEPRRGDWSKVDISNGYFVGNDDEYKAFGKPIERIKTDTLLGLFFAINAADKFIGNQSLPLAIAHSLGVPRVAVLNEIDKAAYVGEEEIHKNFSYVL